MPTMLAPTLIPLCKLIPQREFSPFLVPGMGMVLCALAVFPLQFRKRAPAAAPDPETRRQRSLAVFLLIFALMTTGIVAVGYQSYRNHERQFRAQVERQLSAIAELKVRGLEGWRAERMGDAQVMRQNLAFAALIERYLENPTDTQARARTQGWLDSLRSSYYYDQVFLLDTGGGVRISSPTAPEPEITHLTQESAAVLRAGQVTWLDFHRHAADGDIHLSLLVPVFAEQDARPLGLLVLHIDPNTYLYPYIQQWPAPSASAETLLIRREGDEVVFLNELRFQTDAALNLRLSLKNTQLLAVKAALGQTGSVAGLDYRGAPVIGVISALPDSPWVLVAKVDATEVYAPLRERLWQTVVFFGALIAAAGAGLGLVWRQQSARYYRGQAQAAQALRESEERYRTVADYTYDWEYWRAPDGRILYMSPSCERITGYPAEEFMANPALLESIVVPEDRPTVARHRSSVGLDDRQGGVHEADFRILRRDGQVRWIAHTCQAIRRADGVGLGQRATNRDITERKQAEEEIRLKDELLRLTGEMTRVGGWEFDALTLKGTWTDEVARIHGLDPGQETDVELGLGVYSNESRATIERAVKEAVELAKPYDLELEMVSVQGQRKWVRTMGLPVVEGGKVVKVRGIFQDITERRQAEELIRRRLELMDFAASHSLQEVLQETLDQAGALTGSPIGFYHFVESDQKTLSLQAWSTHTSRDFCRAAGAGLHYPLDQAGVWVDCVYAKKPVIHNDYASLPHRKGMPEGHAQVVRELVVPILRADQIVAILGVGNKAADYTQDDVDLVAYFADVAWEIAERKQAEALLDQQLDELRRWHQATLGREERILELKREVNLLLGQTGQPPRYLSGEGDAP